MQQAPTAAELQLLWTTPITAELASGTPRRSEGFAVIGVATTPHDSLTILGRRLSDLHPMLLVHAERGGPEGAEPIRAGGAASAWSFLRPAPDDPDVSALAIGAQDELWLGGSANRRGFLSLDRCDAYLATLRADLTLRWQGSYGAGNCTTVEDIAPLPSGGAVVVGRQDRRRPWLARIAPDGRLASEQLFGNGKGAAVTALSGAAHQTDTPAGLP